MINRYDDFTRLEEMVLGQVNYSPLNLISDSKDKTFLKDVLDETAVVLESLEKIMKQFNVTVWRPEVFDHTAEMKLGSPYCQIETVHR